MRNRTLFWANVKKQKGSLISLFLLIFIITVFLCAVLAIQQNSNVYENTEIDRLGYGDICGWVVDPPVESGLPTIKELIEDIKELQDTEKVEEQPTIFVKYVMNGKQIAVEGQINIYNEKPYEYHIFKDDLSGFQDNPDALLKGEVYVSPAFASLYHSKPGDIVEIKMTADTTKQFTIKGFFEDPFMGSAMMGIKTFLVCKEEFDSVDAEYKDLGTEAIGYRGSALHIFMKEQSTLSVGEYQGEMNDKTDIQNLTILMYQKNTIAGFMLILQNLFAGFLLLFVATLLVIAMIVMSHSINSSIEQDYVNIGICKAVGFTNGKLRILMLIQYLLAAFCGIIPGMLAATPLVSLINRLTVTATGLQIPGNLPFGICVFILSMIVLLLAIVILVKTTKIGKVSPIRAIRGGANDVYFKSRSTLPIHKKGIGFGMALRQLSSNKKQYAGVLIITILLVFFLTLTTRSRAWMGTEGQGLMNAFGATPYDIEVLCMDPADRDEVNDFVSSHTEVLDHYLFKLDRGTIKGVEYMMNVTDVPENYHIISGRTCLYDNEMVITEMAAKELNVKIGDTVSIVYLENEKDFLITGINQCANDLGANFSVNVDGYHRLGVTADDKFLTFYYFADYAERKPMIEALEKEYGDSIQVGENTWSGMDSVLGAMSGLTVSMYIVSVLFILIITAMTASKILYKEKHDLGIYRSLGFTAKSLRVAFALRFGLLAAVGSLLGVVLSIFLTNPIVSIGVKMCGISNFESEFNILHAAIPAFIIMLTFFLFGYFCARKIRNVQPTILIAES